jgi:signal transduction histidine kinase
MPLLVTILALVGCMGAGLLVTANIQYSLFLLHLSLWQLAEGQSTESPRFQWLWPCSMLFRSLDKIKRNMEELFLRERLTDEYREQLLQQASEAAALEERNRLARELHDSIKQQLFSIRMSAIAAKKQVQDGDTKVQDALEDIQRSSTEAQVEMQALLQQLRSAALENTSLAEAVQTQAQALEYRSGAQVSVDIANMPTIARCPLPMQEALFRIVQEAFANIARHARAQQVWCTITQDDDVLNAMIQDDGQGFAMQSVHKGMGLANIQERAHRLNGTTQIESVPGKGTTIRVQIPLLLSSEARQQQELQEQQAQSILARALGGLQLRATMALFTLLVLVIDVGLLTTRASANKRELAVIILGFCLFLLFYGLISAHFSITRASHYRGTEDREVRSLRLQEYRGWVASLRLLLLSSWHIVPWVLYWPLFLARWQRGGLLLLGAEVYLALILFMHYQIKHAQDRYYSLLSGNSLMREIAQRRRDFRWRIMLYLCACISLFLNGLLPSFMPVTLGQWLIDCFFYAIFILFMGLVIDMVQLQPWKKRAATMATNTGR